jgi:hypothetical protein
MRRDLGVDTRREAWREESHFRYLQERVDYERRLLIWEDQRRVRVLPASK